MIKKILLFIAIMVFSPLIILEILSSNKFIYGLKVADIKIGGRNLKDGQKIIDEHLTKFNKRIFILKYDKATTKLTAEELGLKIDKNQTIENAYNYGRKNHFFKNSWIKIKTLFIGANLPLTFTIDQDKLETALSVFNNIETKAQDAELYYDKEDGSYKMKKSKEGKMFDRNLITKNLINIVQNISGLELSKEPEKIELKLINTSPEITEKQISALKDYLNNLISNAPYYLTFEDKNFPITKELIIQWLTFKKEISNGAKQLIIDFNDAEIKNYLANITPLINREATDAELKFENNEIKIKTPSSDKIELLINETSQIIKHNFLTNHSKQIEAYIQRTPAKINEKNLNELGIRTLLGSGTSNYKGSPPTRILNLKIAAAKFQHYIIPPNQEFSFSKILGPIGPEQGYVPEYVIKSGKTIKEYGGGICQVSTTVFRAAVNSGLKITERYPHAYPVKYYNPQGFDATVYPPSPDLKFINDTGNNILIQVSYKEYEITFEFYGTSDGRKIKVIGPFTYATSTDGSMKTKLIQRVTKNGTTVEKIFYSNYKSPALYPIVKNPLE